MLLGTLNDELGAGLSLQLIVTSLSRNVMQNGLFVWSPVTCYHKIRVSSTTPYYLEIFFRIKPLKLASVMLRHCMHTGLCIWLLLLLTTTAAATTTTTTTTTTTIVIIIAYCNLKRFFLGDHHTTWSNSEKHTPVKQKKNKKKCV